VRERERERDKDKETGKEKERETYFLILPHFHCRILIPEVLEERVKHVVECIYNLRRARNIHREGETCNQNLVCVREREREREKERERDRER
jgi:hypothetical protein